MICITSMVVIVNQNQVATIEAISYIPHVLSI